MEEVIETPRLQFVGPLPGCLDSGDLERAVALVAAEVGPKARLSPPRGSVLNVLFAAEDEIRALNHEFLGVDGATDVLSFGEDTDVLPVDMRPPEEPVVFGELVLCPDYVTRYARRTGTEPVAELLLCFVHGFLHLLGLDHGTAEDEDAMFSLQDRVVRRLGHSPRPTYRGCSVASGQP
ncbi:MAG: rRNA maturation RNase YbeY [Caldilineaceae bacterium SB0665_bin_21]|nr:rRNA maturation RNase YbeY [Caldilineaceae bacterium SB0665_bin_21]